MLLFPTNSRGTSNGGFMLKRSRSGSSLIWKTASFWMLICVCIFPISTLHGQPVLPGNPPFYQNQNSDKLIVFIHGVNGDPRDTWTYKDADPNFFWPQQLAKDPSFQNADVLSFGYRYPRLKPGFFGFAAAWRHYSS